MAFALPEFVKLAQLPTPIEKLEKITRYLEGPQLYIKRDDLTGVGTTGNKIRKLEFLLSEALKQKCDYVITCGGHQSNHARTTAFASAKLGLRCHLLLRNGMGAALEGNLFLSRLVGAEVQFVTADEYERIDDLMQEIAHKLQDKGHRAYIISEGGSNDLGAMGYVKAVLEISEQLKAMKFDLHHIVVAVGSGGTYAGLLLGKLLYNLPAEIHGINVCDDESYFVKRIYDIMKKAQKRFDLDLEINKKQIRIIDGYVGKGYGLSSQEEIDLIKMVAKVEGIVLDPVYNGKAMLGLADQIRKGKFTTEENILYIHTGGIYGIFPKNTLFF